MKKQVDSIVVNGIEYIPKGSVTLKAESLDGMPFVIVRTYSAGVYFGWLKEEKKDECILANARNVWYWKGAATLLQMAVDGVNSPDECKFSKTVSQIKLKNVIAIIECTKEAQDNLTSVKIWEE